MSVKAALDMNFEDLRPYLEHHFPPGRHLDNKIPHDRADADCKRQS